MNDPAAPSFLAFIDNRGGATFSRAATMNYERPYSPLFLAFIDNRGGATFWGTKTMKLAVHSCQMFSMGTIPKEMEGPPVP